MTKRAGGRNRDPGSLQRRKLSAAEAVMSFWQVLAREPKSETALEIGTKPAIGPALR